VVELKNADKVPLGATVTIKVWVDTIGKEEDKSVTDSTSQSDIATLSIEPRESSQSSDSNSPIGSAREQAPATEVAVERVIVVEEGCTFQWGTYGSSYSTNFSGYTNCSQTLSPLHGSESDHWHHHAVIVKKEVKIEVKKVTGKEFLKGVVKGARDLIKADSDGTDSYVTVELLGKGKSKKKLEDKSKRIEDTSNPDYDYPFDLGEVKKGFSVEFTVWQSHKWLGDSPIGVARTEVKNIELDSTAVVSIELSKPKKPKHIPKGYKGPWGTLLVEFNKSIV
jgi:hypothetical protein